MNIATLPQPGRTGWPIAPLTLTPAEQATREQWARIILRCAAGLSNMAVAADLGVSRILIGQWRQRFVTKRFRGLGDASRSPSQMRR